MDKKGLGEFIKSTREAKFGKSRKLFTEKFGIDYGYLNNIEGGFRVPGTEMLIQLAEILEVEPGLLLNILAGYNQSGVNNPEHRSRSEVTDLENLEEYQRDLAELPDLEVLREMLRLNAALLQRMEQSQNRGKTQQPKS